MEDLKSCGSRPRSQISFVVRISGGMLGGGSQLTREGEDILNRYENFQKEVAEAVKRSFIKNFGNSGES